ncbi:MAG: CCA tRNA nucleotidyltransferase [Cohaesibacter sp.]|nr:CCA tRNA nucleotidyltransferase [Cohaesibacter sp.]
MMFDVDVRQDEHFAWRFDPCLTSLFCALNVDGDEMRVVGGAVRNSVLGLAVGDIDCATTALPEQTMERGAQAGFKVIPTGLDHGTITLVKEGRAFEVTSLRADVQTDGRHAVVAFGRDWQVDAARRDFTMNALYLDAEGQIYDPLGSGLCDARARSVRFIGQAHARIEEDYLRILRFFRFFAQYGHSYGKADYEACIALQCGLQSLSAERIGVEMIKLVQGEDAVPALTAMLHGGLLPHVSLAVPMVRRFAFYLQRVKALGLEPSLVGRLMALLGHSRESLDALMLAWRQPNRLRDALRQSMQCSQMFDAKTLGNADLVTLKRWSYRYGKDVVLDCLCLHEGGHDVEALSGLVQALQSWERPVFPLTGKDLIKAGVKPGPQLGQYLSECERRWIESEFRLGKSDLLSGFEISI